MSKKKKNNPKIEDDMDIYVEENIDSLKDCDGVSEEEAGFMNGYIEEVKNEK